MDNPIRQVVDVHKRGKSVGITSVCSSNRYVLEALMKQAVGGSDLVLIESTSNQVDQFGGYSGMTPDSFTAFVHSIAEQIGLTKERIVLGGDHLGPNVWQNEPVESAMTKAKDQIRAYARSGYLKIHLDTSMRFAGDPGDVHTPLPDELVAERAAELCKVAEASFVSCSDRTLKPVYVIGTEVPIPGGAQETLTELKATTVEHAQKTIEVTKQAFLDRGLDSVWERVIAVVVQPGVEFGDTTIVDYDRKKAESLSLFIEQESRLVYEAHSTDYQTRESLMRMVEDHFVILKVGPALTFAFREAVFALASMENEWLANRKSVSPSMILDVIERVMTDRPEYWRKHYRGEATAVRFARRYSHSDRIRYYWPDPAIADALSRLIQNLSKHTVPLNLLSQVMPAQYRAVREKHIRNHPLDLIHDRIGQVIRDYHYATHPENTHSK